MRKSNVLSTAVAAASLPVVSALLFLGTVKQVEAEGCPIVFDLNGNGRIDITGHNSAQEKLYTVFSIGRYVSFDIFGNGEPVQIDWVTANTDAFLVDFRKGIPEKITGVHLFGQTSGGEGEQFANGFDKLKSLDANTDGLVSENELEGLSLWKDDGDAILEKSEILDLQSFGINSIPTTGRQEIGSYGVIQLSNEVQTTNGKMYIEDIWFMTSAQPPWFDALIGSILHPFSQNS